MTTPLRAKVSKERINEAQDREPELIAAPEACRILGLHRNTLYRLITEGEIPAFRLSRGGRWRFNKKDLQGWLEDKQAKGAL